MPRTKDLSLGSRGEWNDAQSISKNVIDNSSQNTVLNIETPPSKSSATSDVSAKGKNVNRSNAALRTISEHSSDRSSFVSPSQHFDMTSPASALHQSQLASSFLKMTAEGRFVFNNNTFDGDDEASSLSAFNNTATFDMNDADVMSPTTESSLRKRAFTGQSSKTNKSETDQTTSSNQWEQVKSILRKDDTDNVDRTKKKKPEIETGVWTVPTLKSTINSLKKTILDQFRTFTRWTRIVTCNNPLTQKIAKDSTYAVVTFSSRQAAVAARHCVADGRGVHRWLSLETVPVVSIFDQCIS